MFAQSPFVAAQARSSAAFEPPPRQSRLLLSRAAGLVLPPLLPFALLGCGAAQVEQGDTRPAIVATVFASALPRPAPTPRHPSQVTTPSSEPDEPASGFLAGVWTEEFEGRFGCQDGILVRQSPSGLSMSGVDCNDNEAYDFKQVSFDGRVVSITVLVPSSGYELRYRLELRGRDDLEGEAEVVGGGTSTTYKVKWTRESDP